MYIDDSVVAITGFEGCVQWMYLDSRGNVTTGVGLLLADSGAACQLPFQVNDSPATPDAIVADFNRVKAMKADELPGFYHSDSSPILQKTDIAIFLRKTICANDSVLAKDFVDYASFPNCVKLALLDMEYNLGNGGLMRGYPHMDAAIKAQDWVSVANNCHRAGINDARNQWTYNQFMSAVPQPAV